ncbi:hypothetical protein UlMin_037992 [Ulmus minor]
MRLLPQTISSLFSSHSSSTPLRFLLQFSHFSTLTSYSSRRYSYESHNVGISVWWDFENCGLPAGINVFKVAHAITAAVRANGLKGPIQITAFGDVFDLSRANQRALSSTGINLSHIPRCGKNGAGRSLVLDLMYWVSQNSPPAHLFLISGEEDLASVLHRVRMKNYNVLLASPENAPDVLCSAASIMWHWHDLLRGENLCGKHFNHPPDGPYGSWYGQCKVPIVDPFSDKLLTASSCAEESSSSRPPLSGHQLGPIPKAVIKKIKKLLDSHPKGLSISELRSKLIRSNMITDKNFYGYKTLSRFLLSMPRILRLQHLGDGHFHVLGTDLKSSESFECDSDKSSVPDNNIEDYDASLSSKLDCDERSAYECPDDILSLPSSPEKLSITSSLNLNVNERLKKAELPSHVDQKTVENVDAPDSDHLLDSVVEPDSAYEGSYFNKAWRKWFGSTNGGSNNEGNENLEKGKDEKNYFKSTTQAIDPVCPSSSSDKCNANSGLLYQIVKWCKSWSGTVGSDKTSNSSCDRSNMTVGAGEHDHFSEDTVWCEMESFITAPKGSHLISESKTREQLAYNLQKEGPLCLKPLSKTDLLHLVELLISEKKWLVELPSKVLQFKLAHFEKSSRVNRLRSVFFGTAAEPNIQKLPEHDREETSQNVPCNKLSPPDTNKELARRTRIEILADCRKLVKEILREHPEGYNMGLFKNSFLERYGYRLDLQRLGYKKLVLLLQIIPGVKIESCYIIPSDKFSNFVNLETDVPDEQEIENHKVADSDCESSDASTEDDDSELPWEDLGPSENEDSRVDCWTNIAKLPDSAIVGTESGTSLGNLGKKKQSIVKSYSFVSDQVSILVSF